MPRSKKRVYFQSLATAKFTAKQAAIALLHKGPFALRIFDKATSIVHYHFSILMMFLLLLPGLTSHLIATLKFISCHPRIKIASCFFLCHPTSVTFPNEEAAWIVNTIKKKRNTLQSSHYFLCNQPTTWNSFPVCLIRNLRPSHIVPCMHYKKRGL